MTMRALLSAAFAMLLVAPAIAQEASPRTDWTKPVIVDTNKLVAPPEDIVTRVEVDGVKISPEQTCAVVQRADAAIDLLSNAGVRECIIRSEATTTPTGTTDLSGYSPEMREKLSRYLPKPKQD